MTVRDLAEALRAVASDQRTPDHLPGLADLMRMIRNWETDKHGVTERYQMLFCRVFGITQEQLLADAIYLSPSRHTSLGETGAYGGDEPSAREEDDVERRRMLQALAALGGVSLSPFAEALQTIRAGVETTLGRDTSAQLDDWDETVAEYGYTYLTKPPDQLISELAADLVSVQAMKPHLPVDGMQRSRWYRVTAGLSVLMAKTLANIRQTRAARTWWTTALHAAERSGDIDLSMWIGGERLVRGLYERRPAPILLRQAAAVTGSGGGRTNPGLLQVYSMRTQLFAATGRRGDALAELRQAEDAFTRLPSSATNDIASTWSYGEDRIHYTTTWVYAHLGEREPLDVAADQALLLLKPAGKSRSVTQIRLLQAAGYIRSGDISAGVTHAAATYDTCPPDQRTALVTELAGDVWNAIPLKLRDGPEAKDYRELLASGPSRRAIT